MTSSSDFTARARAALTKTAGLQMSGAVKKAMSQMLASHGLPPDSPYVLLAGSAMYFHGLRPSIRDLDAYVPGLPVDHETKFFNGIEVDAKPVWTMWDGRKLLADSVVIDGVRVMDLKSLLRMKLAMNRPKDQADIAVLRTKTAALKPGISLQPHQADAVARSRDSSGLLLNWGLGSGKTIGSLALAEDKGGSVLVVTPAALRENFRGQLKAHVSPLRHGAYTVISYDEFRRDPEGWVSRVRPTTLIADELQRLRNPAPREPFEKVRGRVKFMVGLTGSLVSNRPEEMVPLVNLVAGSPVLGSQESFKRKFIEQKSVSPGVIGRILGAKPGIEERPKNLKELGRLTAPYVHRFTGDKDFAQHMPSVTEKTVAVPMDPQQEVMMKALSSTNPIIAFKLRHNLPPNKKELKDMNAFLSAARQISNQPSLFSTKAINSPKFQAMLDDIVAGVRRDKNFKVVIYSNFIDSGVSPLVNELNRKKIPAAAFTGALNDRQRRELVADFNAGRIKVLGLTPAGGEGLDLKGVKMIQLTEEHWNPERGKQAIGRGARFKSHAHLPEPERKVDVRRYQAVHNPSIWNKIFRSQPPTSADQWIDARRREKAELNAKFTGAVPEFNKRP